MTRPFWLLPLLALVLAACPGPIDLPDGGDDNTLIVGPQGGLFVRNGYVLDVPAGAFDAEQRIFVTIVDTGIPDVPMRKRISLGYRLSPSSLVPKVPLTLFLPWVPSRTVAGVDPGTYDLRRQVGSDAYTALPGAKTNLMPVENVEAKTDKLGLFWVTSPAQPNIERLEIDPADANLRVGDTQQFTARVVSPTGDNVDVPVSWSVAPARVASIDAAGLLTALDPGVATVTVRAGMQSTTAKVYVQGTTVGPGTYQHENPFPTGNDLFGGAFAPGNFGTVYAGGNGTVLIEDSLGAWTRAFSTPGVTLKAVGGTSLTDAVAIGQANGAGVLIQFKGATMPPVSRVFQPTQISDLTALWFDGTHGMGVGTGNEVVIRRNGQWTTEYHPSFEALLSVIGDGQGSFVVVGDLGSIYKWDPVRKVWDSLYDTRLAVKLDAAQLIDFASGEAWAVGGNRLWHFVGTGWVTENLPATPALTRATSLALFDGRLFVGGELRLSNPLPGSRGAVLVRSEAAATDGGLNDVTWTSFELRGQQAPRGIFGSGTQGRVVGDFGAVWAWNSATADFTEKSVGFQGNVADLAVTDTDLFAAVNECVDVKCLGRRGVVMHRGPAGFVPLGTFPTTEPVHALVARGNSEVIVSAETGVWLWDGTSWTSFLSGLSAPLQDLAWCGETLWGASLEGKIFKGSLARLEESTTLGTAPLYAIHCPTPTELWVAGTQTLASNSGLSGWQQRTSDTVSQGPWQAVWSPGAGEGFAFGDAMFGVYWDTQELQLQDATGPIGVDVATAMWGNKIDNLYMTGLSKLPSVFGFMLRFDGINWTLVDSGAHRKGTALIGKSTNEIWLGTEGGGVLKAVPPN